MGLGDYPLGFFFWWLAQGNLRFRGGAWGPFNKGFRGEAWDYPLRFGGWDKGTWGLGVGQGDLGFRGGAWGLPFWCTGGWEKGTWGTWGPL